MNIFEKLKTLQAKAYAPYSGYPVAALLVLENGEEVPGVNVENKAFGSTICAERSAFVSAVSNQGIKTGFREIHLLAGTGADFATPCGSCRQVMAELVDPQFVIRLYNAAGEYREFTMADLLPHEFKGPDAPG